MHKILLLTLFLFATVCAHSQFYPVGSEVLGGNSIDEAMDIAINHDSSAIFLGGRTFSSDIDVPGNNGGSDYWIIKRKLDGTVLWNKTYGGFNNDDLSTVMPHTDGGVIAFGTTRNEQGEFGDLKGIAGAWLIRTNAMGDITRGKIFGEDISENGIDAIRHLNGNITMAIEASSPDLDNQVNNGIFDVWIVQVDANLNLRWSILIGGQRQDSPAAIATDITGNIYVAATSQSNLPGLAPNFGEKDLWVFKLDPLGELLWQKNFGGTEDDIANDIYFDPAGDVFVLSHSASDDGDFTNNRGFSDLWLIKMNAENGDPIFFTQYGGDGTDANGNIARLNANQFVISATTNSDTFDLSANKGFNDVWLFKIDLAGNIQQEMNYGGTLNDQAGDILVSDSIIYMFNSTLSSDKNVPANGTTQQDLWLYTLDAAPEPCSDELICQQDSTSNNELFPPANEELICVGGCTAGLSPGPDFIQGSCPDFIHATAYYRLYTDTTADLLTLTVFSNEFNEPHLALLRSGNCTAFTQVACAQGSDGFVLLQYVDVDPLATYIIAVSDASGNVGDFEFCATSVDVEFCNQQDKLYVNSASLGSPLSGPFLPGELVQICYELEDWNKIDCNGFQGLIPTFGPGWDPEGFDNFGMPVMMDSLLMPVANGFWDWYKVGDVHYNVNNPISGYGGGQGMAPGWYFTNLGDVPPNNGPDQTTGDIDECQPTNDKWKVCFTLPVEDECETNLDLSISMRTFSDGELGVNTSLACAYDQEENLSIGMVCCINPTVLNIAERSVCSGDTLILYPATNILPPVTYSWGANPDSGIEGATNGMQQNSFYQILTNETNTTLDVEYILWAEGVNCQAEAVSFTVHVYPKPTSRITISGPSVVCSGTPVTLNFENTGTPPFAIEITRDNQFFANVLSESPNISIEIDPVFSGRFRVGNMEDKFCNGEGLGFVNVTVKPSGSAVIDTAICEGEMVIAANDTFVEPGTYLLTLDNQAANGCDSIISLSLSITPSITQEINEMICNGDTVFVLGVPYTQTTQQIIEYTGPLGCPDFIILNLVILDTLTDEFNQTICGGDTLQFEGISVFETGSYSHVVELTPGCFAESLLNLTVLPEIEINDQSILGDNGSGNGAILLEIKGGSPPFTYMWSSGHTTESLFNIMHGNYSITVTDRLGCSMPFTFNVPLVNSTGDVSVAKRIKLWPTLLTVNDKIFVHTDEAQDLNHLIWFDIKGRRITESVPAIHDSNNYTFDVPDEFSSGLYFISLTFDEQTTWHKVVVE